jgi:hypothetical protein
MFPFVRQTGSARRIARRKTASIKPCIEGLEDRIVLAAQLPYIDMMSAQFQSTSTVQFTYSTYGYFGTPPACQVGLYRSADTNFDASDTLVDLVTISPVPSNFPVTGTSKFSLPNILPSDLAHPYFLVVADPNHLITDLQPSSVTVVVATQTPPNTTVSLTSPAAMSALNNTVSFTATVASSTTGTPTGTVTFQDNGNPIVTDTLSPTGVARLTVSLGPAGSSHTINAVYSGDSSFFGSISNNLTQSVTAATPTGSWTSLMPTNPANGPANGNTSALMLLSDGTVMAQAGNGDVQSTNWYRLTPNAAGSYVNGAWSGLAPMSLPRLFFPTVMLPDGRVLAIGGEYSGPVTTPTDSNTGEIFNPLGGVAPGPRSTPFRARAASMATSPWR